MMLTKWEDISTLSMASHSAYTGDEVVNYTTINDFLDPDTGFSYTIYKMLEHNEYIIAFRGTEASFQDIYTDLNLGMPQWTDALRGRVSASIRSISSEAIDPIFHFTGHSLGGALAQYAAYDYAMSDTVDGHPKAAFDLVTFNALGGVLALSNPELWPEGFDTEIAASINAAHFKIKSDVVSRLGDGHVGGNLLAIDVPVESPLSAHFISNFVGGNGNAALTVADYQSARVESDYLNITQLVAVSGMMATFGDDGVVTSEEALLRTIAAFSFGITNGDGESLSRLVAAFFGEPSTIGQSQFNAWVFLGERAIDFLQHTNLIATGNVVGAYALALANILQWSSQFWEQHPDVAHAVGLTIDTFMDGVVSPGMLIAETALEYALDNEFVAEEFQEAVDFIRNTFQWAERFFPWNSENALYLAGTGSHDMLLGDGNYWLNKSADDRIFGYGGDDYLEGGLGTDYLFGGKGADRYVWNNGDGDDFIGDYDDAGDRIIVNDIDLATLNFKRQSADSPYYVDPEHPDIILHYAGGSLTINIGKGPDAGSISVIQYTPATGADYGIALNNYISGPDPVTAVTVATLGVSNAVSANQTHWNAYDRQYFHQRGINWQAASITFDAQDVSNYSAGSMHGTYGGAFEGGPANDYLAGNQGQNALHGLAGDDRIEGREDHDFLEGGAGTDLLFGGEGGDLLFGSARADLAQRYNEATPYDQFYLAQIADVEGDFNILSGDGGNDFLTGGEYTDYMDGGAGVDYLLGGTGADYISGGTERDIIYGDSALHYRYVELTPSVFTERLEIAFADGVDDVWQYDDVVHGGSGNDTVWGELGDDEIYGESGDDNLIGDRINIPSYFATEIAAYGDTTPELSVALHGDDKLYGGEGTDLLLGLGGEDLLSGGTGSDVLLGGAGDDVYFFQAGDGLDRIEDIEGSHTLVFSGIALRDLNVRFNGSHVFVSHGAAEGFYLSRSQWNNVRLALDTPDAIVERSRLDTQYLDSSGNLLMTIKGNATLTESQRDTLFTVNTTDPQNPRIDVKPGVSQVSFEGIAGGSEGGRFRIVANGMQFFVEVPLAQLANAHDFLSLPAGLSLTISGLSGSITGTHADDLIVGSDHADMIIGLSGNDVLEGRGGNDELDGGDGRDIMLGGDGDDVLRGSQSWYEGDVFDGGRGSDVFYGSVGFDVYRFASGDGQDRIIGSQGSHSFEFAAGVNPASVVLRYTDTTDSRVRIEYGQGDVIVAEGGFSSHWISGVTVGGTMIPLVHRSNLEHGTFRDTRWHDVFEPGSGIDTIHISGYGNNVIRIGAGDGQDVVKVGQDLNGSPRKGEIRFASNVDLQALSFSFTNADAVIAYGAGDRLTLDTATVISHWDNTFVRFTLASEANPNWIPVIRAQGFSGNLYGTYGKDRIVGGIGPDTIIPGYGDDIIEAGEDDDWILLNNLYMSRSGGIGHKDIRGQGGNDTIQTPLFQGLAFQYNRGDGDDRIEYDWSYSSRHPYLFTLNDAALIASFIPYGQDTLAFGSGIALGDLRFVRYGDSLAIQLKDGSGGVNISDFFHAWDVERGPGMGSNLYARMSSRPDVDTLREPAILAVLPRTPIASLRFADGSVLDMVSVLNTRLEESTATILGTEGDDTIYGTDVDEIIHTFGGDDYIEDQDGSNIIDSGAGDDRIVLAGNHIVDAGVGNDNIQVTGNNTLRAGAGNDRIVASGNNTINAGPGFDTISLLGGHNILQFGPGDGLDYISFTVRDGVDSTIVEMAEGLTVADIRVNKNVGDGSESLDIVLLGTGDVLFAEAKIADAEGTVSSHPRATFTEVRFSDGTVLSSEDLFAMAHAGPTRIDGTDGNDLLVGTAGDDDFYGGRGDDTMQGGGGSDYFFVEGHDQGADRISGGEDFDVILGGDGDDTISLVSMSLADSIEEVNGGLGLNAIRGTAGNNILNFTNTELVQIHHIDGRAGNDDIRGSQGDNIIIGGMGNDILRGLGGNDLYLSGRNHGRDQIANYTPGSTESDALWIIDADYDDLWLSRSGFNLLIDVVGTNDQVQIVNWYYSEDRRLDAIYSRDRVLWANQVDQLVNAMAGFNAPTGVGAVIPQAVQSALEPTLTSVWHQAA